MLPMVRASQCGLIHGIKTCVYILHISTYTVIYSISIYIFTGFIYRIEEIYLILWLMILLILYTYVVLNIMDIPLWVPRPRV